MSDESQRAERPTRTAARKQVQAQQYACLDAVAAEWLLREVVPNPAACSIFLDFACKLARHGKLNKPNWIRATVRDLQAACKLSPRTVLAATTFLIKSGYLIRNKADPSLYRIPPSAFRCAHAGRRVACADDRLPLPKEIVFVPPKVGRNDTVSSKGEA